MIKKIVAPDMPWLLFEWHPIESRLYVVRRKRGNPAEAVGLIVAEGIMSEGAAELAARHFIAGYNHRGDEKHYAGPRGYSMTLEPIRIGAKFIQPFGAER